MNNDILKFLYALFIGIFAALFIGLGIDTFYKGPARPDYGQFAKVMPLAVDKDGPSEEYMAQMQAQQMEFDRANNDYQAQLKIYNRDVSIISMAAAVLLVAAGLLIFHKINLIADGMLLGGVATLGYSAVRGFMTDMAAYRFLAVSAGLAAVLAIGYFRFLNDKKLIKIK